MDFREYETAARSTAVYPPAFSGIYPALGLAGETGEVCEKVKKAIRIAGAGWMFSLDPGGIKKELGDVLWYLAALTHDLGFSLEEIAEENIKKLQDRKERGVIEGGGDNR